MIVIKVNYTTDAPIIKVNYDDAPIYISTTVDATYISVDYGSGAATNAVWGDITGTLSDQTDLQNALDDKVPYTGATGNVDLGEYELKAGQLTLDTSPTGTASVGTTRWNDSIGSSETTLKGGSVILKNGVDLVARVVNKVTPNTTLTKAAYQAVRISGAQGQRLAVAFAQANNDNNSADTIGLVTETIATNQEGFIMTVGNLEDINTTGSLQGETWADGDVLYLSPTVAGAITNIKPVAPQHLVVIGYVEYAHAVHGKIYVKVMNGWELGELHDVDTTGASAGQVLKYNGTIWTPSSDLDTGITSLNGLTALTQTFATGTSGTDFNISSATSTHTFNLPTASATNRGLVSSSDWSTFNAKIGGTLATGQVAFGSAANTIAGSNNLFWDNTNGRLGIGTNTPNKTLYVKGQTVIDGAYVTQDNTTITGGVLHVRGTSASGAQNGGITIATNDPNSSIYRLRLNGNSSSGGGEIGVPYGYALTLQGGGTYFGNAAENGPVVIGSKLLIGTTTDSGQRLQVNGDAFIKGSGNTSATTALTVQNSAGSTIFSALNNRVVGFGATPLYDGTIQVSLAGHASRLALIGNLEFTTGANGTWTGQYIRIDGANRTFKLGLSNSITTDNNALLVSMDSPSGAGFSLRTSGTIEWALFDGISFFPTSGTAVFNQFVIRGTINQTGGANGITRGLYVNPTLTAAADWRSIEWSNTTGYGLYGAGSALNYISGRIAFGTALPSSTVHLTLNGQITGGVLSYGMLQTGFVRSDVTTYAVGIGNRLNKSDANTLPAYYNFFAIGGGSISGAVTNEYGFSVGAGMTGATNSYGFYGDLAASGTNRWNLYCNGTANNYMAGSLGIGSTSLTQFNLRVFKNITGATNSVGVQSGGIVQSDVTASASYFSTELNTQATTFTLSNGYHYLTSQGTIGASSTLSNQYGFFANSNLTGATNNYGFYGNIASGTGRWNFFANGTSANYLNGNTIIGGSAVDGGQKLQVNGDTIMTGSGNTSATNALNVRNSDSTAMYTILNNGYTRYGSGGTSAFRIYPTDTSGDVELAGLNLVLNSRVIAQTQAAGIGMLMINGPNGTPTTGSQVVLINTKGFAPTSGTATYTNTLLQPTINQTGGANGITRGLYINPTLTSAADWRSIETSNNSGWSYYGAGTANSYYGGHISIGTTSTGDWLNIAAGTTAKAQINLAASTAPTTPQNGDIWFDGTDLKMRIGGVTKTFTLV